MEALPHELIFTEIGSMLGLSDLLHLIQCNKNLHDLCNKYGWKQLIQAEFPNSKKPDDLNYYQYYKQLVKSQHIPIISQSTILKWIYFNSKKVCPTFENVKTVAELYYPEKYTIIFVNYGLEISHIITKDKQIKLGTLDKIKRIIIINEDYSPNKDQNYKNLSFLLHESLLDRNNEIPIYGTITNFKNSKMFKIIDYRSGLRRECSKIKLETLYDILWQYKINPTSIDQSSNLSDQQMIKELSRIFHQNILNQYPSEKLLFCYQWYRSKISVNNICDVIYSHLKKTHRLLEINLKH